jgi:hypothetical protein
VPFCRAEGRKSSCKPSTRCAGTYCFYPCGGDVQDETAEQDKEAKLPDSPEVKEEEVAAEEQAGKKWLQQAFHLG